MKAEIIIVGKWSPTSESNGNVYSAEGIAPTLVCGAHGGCEPKIITRKDMKENLETKPINTDNEGNARTICSGIYKAGVATHLREQGTSPTAVMYKGKEYEDGDGLNLNASEKYDKGGLKGLSRTLKANMHDAGTVQDFRIRKLTERECFRLMGVRDYDIDKLIASGISKTQLYKMAGNSIVCDCLMAIFDKMIVNPNPTVGTQLSIF